MATGAARSRSAKVEYWPWSGSECGRKGISLSREIRFFHMKIMYVQKKIRLLSVEMRLFLREIISLS